MIWIVIFSTLILLGVWSIGENVGLSIAVILVGSLLLVGSILAFPSHYRISKEGITVYFAFAFKCSAKWTDLHTVEDHCCKSFPFLREYHVGYFKTNFPLWEKACIPKNRKTTSLIEMYYQNAIDKLG
jgi:hypothetical protein